MINYNSSNDSYTMLYYLTVDMLDDTQLGELGNRPVNRCML